MRKLTLRCYAEGRDDRWEALCLDLDIAVQGSSFEDVDKALREAVCDYVEYVSTLPEEDQKRLLNRKAPLRDRLRFLWYALLATINHDGGDTSRHEFMTPCTV